MKQDEKSPWSPDRKMTDRHIDFRLIEAFARSKRCTCDLCKEWTAELEELIIGKSQET